MTSLVFMENYGTGLIGVATFQLWLKYMTFRNENKILLHAGENNKNIEAKIRLI